MWILWKFLDYFLLYPRLILRIGPPSNGITWLDDAWLTVMLLVAAGFVWCSLVISGLFGIPYGYVPLVWALLFYLAVGLFIAIRSGFHVVSEIMMEGLAP